MERAGIKVLLHPLTPWAVVSPPSYLLLWSKGCLVQPPWHRTAQLSFRDPSSWQSCADRSCSSGEHPAWHLTGHSRVGGSPVTTILGWWTWWVHAPGGGDGYSGSCSEIAQLQGLCFGVFSWQLKPNKWNKVIFRAMNNSALWMKEHVTWDQHRKALSVWKNSSPLGCWVSFGKQDCYSFLHDSTICKKNPLQR